MFGTARKHPRLSQWDGRTRSSRAEPVALASVWRRDNLPRFVAIWAAVIAITALIEFTGPPQPYRLGQTCPRDVRARVAFEVVNPAQTEHLREELAYQRQSMGLPSDEFEIAQAVPPVVEHYWPGMSLVRRDQPITEGQLLLLQKEHRAYQQGLRWEDHTRRALAMFGTLMLLASVVVLYVARFHPALADCPRKISAVCLLVVATVALGLILGRPPWNAMLVPLTVTTLILTIAYNPAFALLTSFTLALVMTLGRGTDVGELLIQMSGLASAVLLLRDVRSRSRLVEVAFGAGVAYAAMTIATGVLAHQPTPRVLTDAGRNGLWSLLAGFILGGCLPLVERAFGVVTDASLRDLADCSHPLLQELIRRAPGTYTHSMAVANLAEAAADEIGANGLLARVGSYYHDIGKMLKPHYFIENQTGENRHDNLEPALSTLVIIGHVKDGWELGKQYRLPEPILDFIQQHHGTTLVEYFYREAMRLQESNGGGSGELEFTFRYPGPKPQSREIGIVMLADAVESSSRALSAPTPGSLRKLIHDLLMKRLLDGQFEDSGLTLTELHRVAESLGKSLIAQYHARIKYPSEVPQSQGA
jgi:putative nucleotidyltransferase with HDIG domain